MKFGPDKNSIFPNPAVGNPCNVIKKRFDDELIEYLEQLQWWNWIEEKIFNNLEILCSNDIERIKEIK